MDENTENTPQDTTAAPETPAEADPGTDTQEAPEEPTEAEETFSRAYVEKLRAEAAKFRTRAKRADTLAEALWLAKVEAAGRLADPSDLPMPEGADPLDAEALTTAVDDLLARKPHLASRRPRGDVGQGVTGGGGDVDLAGLMRARA